MKNSNEAWLELEVLEDRMTPGGAFSGGINAGAPPVPPLLGGLTANPLLISASAPGFRNTFTQANFATSTQVPNLQNQLQSFQAAQTALIDQYFSDLSALLKSLNISTVVVI